MLTAKVGDNVSIYRNPEQRTVGGMKIVSVVTITMNPNKVQSIIDAGRAFRSLEQKGFSLVTITNQKFYRFEKTEEAI